MHCFLTNWAPTFHKGIGYKNDRENAKKVGGIPQHHLHHYEVHGRHKEHRRDGNKANQLKMNIFDTKAHKKTERAQKRQKQCKST